MLWAKYRTTRKTPTPGVVGRPKKEIGKDVIKIVMKEYDKMPAGVVRTTLRIKQNRDNKLNISFNDVYRIMNSKGMITKSSAKSNKRKWVRFERMYSDAVDTLIGIS